MKILPIFTPAAISLALILAVSAGSATAGEVRETKQAASFKTSDGDGTARRYDGGHEVEMDVSVGV